MGDWGVKVSLPGKTVQSTEPRDYVFWSKYGSVKVVQEPPGKTKGTVTVGANTNLDVVIPHNLGFIPLCMVFVETNPGSGRYYSGVSLAAPEDFPQNMFLGNIYDTNPSYADTTNLHINFQNTSAFPMTINYYYFIFGDAGS